MHINLVPLNFSFEVQNIYYGTSALGGKFSDKSLENMESGKINRAEKTVKSKNDKKYEKAVNKLNLITRIDKI